MQINYDEMLTNYNKNMETNLRGFSGGPPPFETWVPYEGDHDKSIKELVELAKNAGHEVVAVMTNQGGVTLYQSDRAINAKVALNDIAITLGRTMVINVVGLKKNVLTIDYEDNAETKGFYKSLIEIEGLLNEKMNEKFDIQTLNIDDKNKRKSACAK